MKLKVYVNADFVGDSNTRKSPLGFMLMRNIPTSWYSKM